MALGTILAAVAAITAVGATAVSIQASNKQAKAEKRARQTERRAAAIENARRVRQAIAERRIREAEIVAQAESQGVGLQSSSITGARGALVGDVASNIGSFNTQIAGNQLASDFRFQGARDSARLQGVASGLNTISSLATFGFNAYGGPKQPTPSNKITKK